MKDSFCDTEVRLAVQELLEKGESRDSFTQRYSLVPADMLSSSDSDGSNTGKRSSSGTTSRKCLNALLPEIKKHIQHIHVVLISSLAEMLAFSYCKTNFNINATMQPKFPY